MKSRHSLAGALRVLALLPLLAIPATARAQFTADGVNANATNWTSITTNDSAPAFIARNGGTITSTGNATGTTSGLASHGVFVETGGAVTFSGGTTITTNGQNANGLFVLNDGSIMFADATVTASGAGAMGARATGVDALLMVVDVNFTAAGRGILTQQGASTIINGGFHCSGHRRLGGEPEFHFGC